MSAVGTPLQLPLPCMSVSAGRKAIWPHAGYALLASPNQTPYRDMYFLEKLVGLGASDGFQLNVVFTQLFFIMGIWPAIYAALLIPSARSGNKARAPAPHAMWAQKGIATGCRDRHAQPALMQACEFICCPRAKSPIRKVHDVFGLAIEDCWCHLWYMESRPLTHMLSTGACMAIRGGFLWGGRVCAWALLCAVDAQPPGAIPAATRGAAGLVQARAEGRGVPDRRLAPPGRRHRMRRPGACNPNVIPSADQGSTAEGSC